MSMSPQDEHYWDCDAPPAPPPPRGWAKAVNDAIKNDTAAAKELQDELVADARRNGKPLLPPNIRTIKKTKQRDGSIAESVLEFPGIVDTADWLDGNLPPVRPDLIQGLVRQGGKLFLGAPSKARKTFTLMHLGMCVAHGLPWWGMATLKTRVLYVNLELSFADAQRRLQSLKDSLGIKPALDNLLMWNLRGHAMPIDALAPLISTQGSRGDFGAIIIDPIYKALGDRNENDAGDMTSFCNCMEHIAQDTGATLIAAMHYAKGNAAAKDAMDRIAGSGVLARDPDAMLMLTPHDEADAFTVSGIVRSHPPLDEFVVRWEFPLMSRDDSLNPTALKGAKGVAAELDEDDVLASVPLAGQTRMSRIAICEEVKAKFPRVGINRIHAMFDKCKAKGLVKTDEDGKKIQSYYLTNSAPPPPVAVSDITADCGVTEI